MKNQILEYLKNIITKLISNYKIILLLSSIVFFLYVGIGSHIPEIKTVSFFLSFELLILFIALVAARIVYHFKNIRLFLYNSFSNFILGLHIIAGMIVLGVYFTV